MALTTPDEGVVAGATKPKFVFIAMKSPATAPVGFTSGVNGLESDMANEISRAVTVNTTAASPIA
jgi:hypothetical protein